MDEEEFQELTADLDNAATDRFRNHIDRVASLKPFEVNGSGKSRFGLIIQNLYISKCYNCSEISIWFGKTLAWPQRGKATSPNPDMPEGAMTDYEEASLIVGASPRGAAALLRLAISKICIALGCDGKNLNNDIAELVSKGLDVRVQQALDIVRVVGNNAVHPGELDIKDDLETAESLFGLVNLIVEIMISQPKEVGKMFSKLPQGAVNAIQKRDDAGSKR